MLSVLFEKDNLALIKEVFKDMQMVDFDDTDYLLSALKILQKVNDDDPVTENTCLMI